MKDFMLDGVLCGVEPSGVGVDTGMLNNEWSRGETLRRISAYSLRAAFLRLPYLGKAVS